MLKLISKAVQWSGFGLIDRVLGCMFGAAKGLIFINLILFMLPTDIKNSSSLGDSVLYAQMQKFNPSIVNFAKSMITDNNSVMLDAYTIRGYKFLMCGIVGITSETNVATEIYESLLMLQHRGQDAAGMVVCDDFDRLNSRKSMGYVRDVFQQRHMNKLIGNYGIGHVRYPTAGGAGKRILHSQCM